MVPVLDERICSTGVVRNQPEGSGVVGTTVTKGMNRDIGSFSAREDEIHLSTACGIGSITDKHHARDRVT